MPEFGVPFAPSRLRLATLAEAPNSIFYSSNYLTLLLNRTIFSPRDSIDIAPANWRLAAVSFDIPFLFAIFHDLQGFLNTVRTASQSSGAPHSFQKPLLIFPRLFTGKFYFYIYSPTI